MISAPGKVITTKPGAENRLVMSADVQQQRVLERLRRAGGKTVLLSELRAGGIDFPAAVVGELEMGGYGVDRVYDHGRLVGARLLEPESSEAPAKPVKHRWPWSRRQ